MPAKSIWASKTLWANAIAIAIDVGGRASGLVPDSYQPYLVTGLGMLNMVLRLLTTQPVVVTPEGK